MKTVVLCGITRPAAATASAQTSTSATAADQPAKTVTLTGCVGGGSESKPITLSNALVVPTTTQPGLPDQVSSPVPPAVSVTGTQPADPTAPPPSATPAVPAPAMPPSPVGTSGTKTPSTPVGTSGIVTGTAPAGSSGSTLTGYRLSGADMQPWIGKRVQVIGTFVPAAPPSPAPSVTGAAAAPPVLEFRVQTVMPTSGPCPK